MTTYVSDTFTAADGTQLVSRLPDIGTGYTVIFGTPVYYLKIESNRLRHVSPYNGSANFYINDVLPLNDFAVQCVLNFASNDFCELELARNGTNYGNLDKFCIVDFFGAGNASLSVPGGSADLSAILLATGIDYTLRVEFTSSSGDTLITYKIDGNVVTTVTETGTWFDGSLGVNIFESAGVSALGLDNLLVESLTAPAPPPPSSASTGSSAVVPDSLPLPSSQNHVFTNVSMAQAVQFETGDVRRRRRYTRAPQLLDLQWELSQTEFDTFHNWFEQTLMAGARQFDLQVASQTSVDVVWNSALFTRPYEATLDLGGKYIVRATLLVTGTPSIYKPVMYPTASSDFKYTVHGQLGTAPYFETNSLFRYLTNATLYDTSAGRGVPDGAVRIQGRTPTSNISHYISIPYGVVTVLSTYLVQPSFGSLTLIGDTPGLSVGINVPTGSIVFSTAYFVQPSLGSISVTGCAPSVVLPNASAISIYNALDAYWEFEQNDSGTQFLDSYSNHTLNITQNGVTPAASSSVTNTGVVGRYFTPPQSYTAHMPTSNASLTLPDSDWSIGGWVKGTNTGGSGGWSTGLIGRLFNGVSTSSFLEIDSATTGITGSVADSSTTRTRLVSSILASSTQWRFVVLTLDKTNNLVRLRIKSTAPENYNNTLSFAGKTAYNSSAGPFNINDLMTNDTTVYTPGNTRGINNGGYDQCFYVHKALTDTEVDYLYNNGNGKSFATLLAEAGPNISIISKPGTGVMGITGAVPL